MSRENGGRPWARTAVIKGEASASRAERRRHTPIAARVADLAQLTDPAMLTPRAPPACVSHSAALIPLGIHARTCEAKKSNKMRGKEVARSNKRCAGKMHDGSRKNARESEWEARGEN
eukprot:565473-Pleurochrysis_carterae.AAC.3